MNTTKQKGDVSELRIVAKLIEQGYTVSMPWGENAPYDLILDCGKDLIKVQIKTGRVKDGVIHFNNYAVTHNTKTTKSKKYNTDDVQMFAIYVPETQGLYLVPNTLKSTSLRLIPAKNGQKEKINMAKDFEIEKVLNYLTVPPMDQGSGSSKPAK